ncbi:class I SAM-dependent methyltransferase [Chitinibacter sp. GC72]|uniref:class I SAM-dependent methyltransferase n=1 Tax=Chitinibacter sp. GC72 TaxID=1526917 RepID=UPI0012F7A9F4|nr:class I SAM-dependent methyltransferase [Chitinibacter sp. GC72]
MKAETPSSTAKLIAASTILLASEPATAHRVAPGAAMWCKRLLSRSWADRLLASSAGYRPTAMVWKWLEQHTLPGILLHYWQRKRWIEARCRLAIAQGFERVIVLGAGFDTLALRLSLEMPQISWLEIDHPATQSAKQVALGPDAQSVQFIACDLNADGLDGLPIFSNKATLVIAEGVLMYLSPAAIEQLFACLQRAPGERLQFVFSFMNQWPDGKAGFRPRSRWVERWLAWRGEPFAWALPEAAMADFLAERGFEQLETATTRQLASNPESMLEGENLVHCQRI